MLHWLFSEPSMEETIYLNYNGFIFLTDKGTIRKSSSFTSSKLPEMKNNSLIWNTSFGNGQWQKIDSPIEEMLLDVDHGLINWRCLFPKAKASFRINDEATHNTLRTGSIGSTIFSRFKKIMAVFPISIFRLEENKWTGKAALSQTGKVVDSGHYIHEEVNWK